MTFSGSKCQDGKNSRVISLWMEPRRLPCVKIVKNSARIFPRICDRQVAQDSCSMATFPQFHQCQPQFLFKPQKKMVIHQARPWNVLLIPQVLYIQSKFMKTNSAFSWATCAPDSFESISCIWDNTDGRTQEIHHLFSHIHGRFYWWVGCFLKGSLPA